MRIVNSALSAALCLVIAACGGGLVRGEPPLIGISTLEVAEREIRTRVDIYNPNGVDMEVDVFEMTMRLGETDLGRHSTRPGLDIHPNGTEEIGFVFPGDANAGRMLAELERGEINSIPYFVSGEVRGSEGKSEKFSQEGYLYPVPGRPGQFRGAGPQRERE